MSFFQFLNKRKIENTSGIKETYSIIDSNSANIHSVQSVFSVFSTQGIKQLFAIDNSKPGSVQNYNKELILDDNDFDNQEYFASCFSQLSQFLERNPANDNTYYVLNLKNFSDTPQYSVINTYKDIIKLFPEDK
jgi:hypothetical protein